MKRCRRCAVALPTNVLSENLMAFGLCVRCSCETPLDEMKHWRREFWWEIQVEQMNRLFPGFGLERFDRGGRFVGHLQPRPESPTYTVRVEVADPDEPPSVWVDDPALPDDQKTKWHTHRYDDGSLCLYYPPDYPWTINSVIAVTLVPWAVLWLFYWEIWQAVGEWMGPESPTHRTTPRTCRRCGCTDRDCRGCIGRTGEPCRWVEVDLCSACEEDSKRKPRMSRSDRLAAGLCDCEGEAEDPWEFYQPWTRCGVCGRPTMLPEGERGVPP